MNLTEFLWLGQPPSVKFFLMGILAAAAISASRFLRLAVKLYHYSGPQISHEVIAKGEAQPDRLAAWTLANRRPPKIESTGFGSSTGTLTLERSNLTYLTLNAADTIFAYRWENCHTDVVSTRRASQFATLMSFAAVSWCALPVYLGCHNDSNLSGSYCLFLTGQQLLAIFGFELSVSAMIFLFSCFFERALDHRKTAWRYLCSRLRNQTAAGSTTDM